MALNNLDGSFQLKSMIENCPTIATDDLLGQDLTSLYSQRMATYFSLVVVPLARELENVRWVKD